MKRTGMLAVMVGAIGATAALSQQPGAAPRTGPGVQAPQDARYPEVIATCKTPPPAGRGGGAKGKGPGAPAQAKAAPGPRQYTVTEIPGVVAAGQTWREVWEVDGNNADGIIGAPDGGLLIAQNDNSNVVHLDYNGKASNAYTGTNTGGSLARNSKGELFVVNRGLNPSIEQLAPQRRTLANRFNGDPLDCLGGVLNDATADSKGGVYFTNGVVYYANPQGVITRYGENLGTNGIVLSADERRLWVTNGPSLTVFDVQADGSLTNQREFARWEGGGGDGSTIDTAGRLYVTTNAGVQVIGPDGKVLGLIPTPRGIISAAFSGPDRKTLYAVSRDNAQNKDWIIAIPMLAQGAERGK
jgi:gluconolactonase